MSTEATDRVRATTPGKAEKRASAGAALGTFIEGYDLSVYGYTAIYLAPLFFPGDDPTVSLLLSLAVFALAYLARPLGGVVFGQLGDRVSRRAALLGSILMMGVATTVIAVLPTYASIGVIAPIVLLLARLMQGFSVGGEVAGATTYVAEISPEGHRARLMSLNAMGASAGFAVAAALVALLSSVLGAQQMAEWGWRIPFLIALPLAGASLWIRSRVLVGGDAPSKSQHEKTPSLTALLSKKNRVPLLQVIAISIAVNATAYIGFTYLSIHLINVLDYSASSVFWGVTAAVGLQAVTMLSAGRVGDRIGVTKLLGIGLVGYAVLALPAFFLFEVGNLPLALIGVVIIVINGAATLVAAYAMLPLLFEPRVRASGMGLGFSLGAVAAGGTAPLFARWLVDFTGATISPAFVVVGAALVGLIALITVTRTGRYASTKKAA